MHDRSALVIQVCSQEHISVKVCQASLKRMHTMQWVASYQSCVTPAASFSPRPVFGSGPIELGLRVKLQNFFWAACNLVTWFKLRVEWFKDPEIKLGALKGKRHLAYFWRDILVWTKRADKCRSTGSLTGVWNDLGMSFLILDLSTDCDTVLSNKEK